MKIRDLNKIEVACTRFQKVCEASGKKKFCAVLRFVLRELE